MPWNDKSGGGGPWGGGGNQGPWGQGPRGPGGPQGAPPDLEDIIRRGQDRLRRAIPGGGGGTPAFWLLLLVVLAVLWAFKAVYTVQPDEVAVELRFGKPKQQLSEPGLHFHWWPIETVETAKISEQLVNIGSGARSGDSSGLMLSGDQNIVNVQFSVAYQVAYPRAYLFAVSDPYGMLRQVAESAMREAVGRAMSRTSSATTARGIPPRCARSSRTRLTDTGRLTVNAVSIEDRRAGRGGRRMRRGPARRQDEDRFVEKPTSIPTRSSASTRPGGAGPRGGGRLQEPRRAGGRGRGAALHLGL